jgi:Fur family transcriptional regulator, ferric uptake regulator
MKSRETLSQELRLKGFRLTPQRETILDIFYNLPDGQHLSAEDLQRLLQQKGADISLATSYRTLKLLASVGVLRELDFAEDHKHYELSGNPDSPHHHLICVSCGYTEEFEAQTVAALAVSLTTAKGFSLTDVQLKVFGLCQDCQNQPVQPRPPNWKAKHELNL